jgi:hypothetical protein
MFKKKYLFLVIIIVLSVFISCTVNENTGLITITNNGNGDASNIKVGGTVITNYLAQGQKCDYWYSKILFGDITGSGVVKNVLLYNSDKSGESVVTRNTNTVEFKVNYEYKIEIVQKDDKNWFYIHGGTTPGANYDDRDNPID